jgi:hypothetical protein
MPPIELPIPPVRVRVLRPQTIGDQVVDVGAELMVAEDSAIRRQRTGAVEILGALSRRGQRFAVALDVFPNSTY